MRDSKDKKDKKSGKKPVDLDHLRFYFDAVERDRLDSAGHSRKTGEVLALRDKLLTLPEGEFDAAIKTLKRMVSEVRKSGETSKDKAKRQARERRQAAQLFEQVSESGGGATASKVDRI